MSTNPEGSKGIDLGLTHVALPVTDLDRSIAFYERWADMQVVHRRHDADTDSHVAWLSDLTRPFVVVLIQMASVDFPLAGFAHVGVGCVSREELDRRCEDAKADGCLRFGPIDSGYPVGYWCFLADPDGHQLELSYGQEVALTVQEAATG